MLAKVMGWVIWLGVLVAAHALVTWERPSSLPGWRLALGVALVLGACIAGS